MPTMNDQNDSDRRREKRWNLKAHLRVFDQETGELLGHAVDIAAKGLQLVSEHPLPVEKNFRLWLEIIVDDGRWEKMPVKALSVWSRQSNTGLCHTGFHIFAMPAASQQHIKRLIDTLEH